MRFILFLFLSVSSFASANECEGGLQAQAPEQKIAFYPIKAHQWQEMSELKERVFADYPENWEGPWDNKLWVESMQAQKASVYVAEDSATGKIVGAVTLNFYDGHFPYLGQLVVEKEYRRRGIARTLLRMAVEECVKRGAMSVDLDTRNEFRTAIPLYLEEGFDVVGSKVEFGQITIQMTLDLRPRQKSK